MKVLFATVDSYELNEKRCKCYEAKDEDKMFRLIEKKKPDVLILEKKFVQKMTWKECVLTLCTRYPKVRIMVVLDKKDISDKRFLYHWMIFDIFRKEEMSLSLLKYRLYFPKTFQDIKSFFLIVSDEEENIYQKTIERYSFLEKSNEFLTRDEFTYIFSQTGKEGNVFLEIKIPYGKEAWRFQVEIKQNVDFQLSESLYKKIEKVKEIFNKSQRIRKVVNS